VNVSNQFKLILKDGSFNSSAAVHYDELLECVSFLAIFDSRFGDDSSFKGPSIMGKIIFKLG
jgi:hypothetical protein